jgi:NAD(P)-dependent dehydrogenase (short-subunit alcohol dehydrogenase family)
VSQDFLNDFRKRYPQHGTTRADVSKGGGCRQPVQGNLRHLGGLDALINNAGIAGPTKTAEEITPELLAEWPNVKEPLPAV